MIKTTRAELFTRLRTTPTEITFKTKDGTQRTLTATLQDGFIKSGRKETLAQLETPALAQDPESLRVFSITDQGFRTVNCKRIVEMRDINLETMTPVRRAAKRPDTKAPTKRVSTSVETAKKRTK